MRSPGSPDGPARSSTFILLIVGFALVRFPETLLLLRLQDLGLNVSLVPLVWAGLHLVRTGGSYPGGWLSDRMGAQRTILVGWASYLVVCAGLAGAATPVAGVVWFLAFGVIASLTESPERALVAATGGRSSGRAFGAYHAGIGFAALPGGLALGGVYARNDAATALLVSGLLTAILCLAAIISRWWRSAK